MSTTMEKTIRAPLLFEPQLIRSSFHHRLRNVCRRCFTPFHWRHPCTDYDARSSPTVIMTLMLTSIKAKCSGDPDVQAVATASDNVADAGDSVDDDKAENVDKVGTENTGDTKNGEMSHVSSHETDDRRDHREEQVNTVCPRRLSDPLNPITQPPMPRKRP